MACREDANVFAPDQKTCLLDVQPEQDYLNIFVGILGKLKITECVHAGAEKTCQTDEKCWHLKSRHCGCELRD